MATASALVSVDRLLKCYGARTVVDELTFEVMRGECFALLGPNGAGKTTAIEILQGVRERTSGSVTVLGADPAGAGRLWRSRLGAVGQTMSSGLDLSVAEMVAHFARYHANPRPHDDLISAVDLQASANVRVPKLSGGQRRRLEVALAIQGRPELLFLDEPTTGLDPVARRSFWSLVKMLSAEGTTIVLTTHHLDEAERLADRVGVINRGRLMAVAQPTELGADLDLPTRIRYRVSGTTTELCSRTPVATVRSLLAQHAALDDLEVRRPTLEDVYLAMIGNRRDS